MREKTTCLPFCWLSLALLLSGVGCASTDPHGLLTERPPAALSGTPTEAAGHPKSTAEEAAPKEMPSGPLTVGGCVGLALRNHPSTRAAYLGRQAAAAGVGVTRAAFYPTLDASAGAGVAGDLLGSQSAPGGDAVTGSLSAGLALRYLLYDGGARRARVQAANAQLDAADFRLDAAVLDVALDAEEAYYSLQGALWYQQTVVRLISQATYQAELARARFDVGLARRYDVVQADARLAETMLFEATAARRVTQARGQLARAMGLDVRTPVSVAPVADQDEQAGLAEVSDLIELALAQRPELGEARAAVEQALAALRVARSGHAPNVSLSSGLSASYGTQGGESVPWSAGVSVSVPLFNGFETTYSVRRADFEAQRARVELGSLVTDIQFEVWNAHADALEATQTIEAARKALAAATESVELAQENYQTGVGSLLELLSAQADRASAELTFVQARIDRHLALARLERVVGRALSRAAASDSFGGQP